MEQFRTTTFSGHGLPHARSRAAHLWSWRRRRSRWRHRSWCLRRPRRWLRWWSCPWARTRVGCRGWRRLFRSTRRCARGSWRWARRECRWRRTAAIAVQESAAVRGAFLSAAAACRTNAGLRRPGHTQRRCRSARDSRRLMLTRTRATRLRRVIDQAVGVSAHHDSLTVDVRRLELFRPEGTHLLATAEHFVPVRSTRVLDLSQTRRQLRLALQAVATVLELPQGVTGRGASGRAQQCREERHHGSVQGQSRTEGCVQ